MKVGAFGSLLALSICLLGLLGLGGKISDNSVQMSLLALTLVTWALEQKALLRAPMDYSTGVVYPLVLGVAGYPAEAALLALASIFIRQLDGRTSYPWDLVAIFPALMVVGFAHLMDQPSIVWGVGGLLVGAASLYFFSLSSLRSVPGQENWLARATEKRLGLARVAVLPLAVVGSVVPPESLWVAALIFPALMLANRFSGDLGYRLEAMSGEKARLEAAESRQHLEDAQNQLRTLSEKQQMMEKLVNVFKEKLGPREAFSELRKITASVVRYDSLFLLRVEPDGAIRVVDYYCEDSRWDPAVRLGLVSEPLLAKAWSQDKALKGNAAQRLVRSDNHLVVVPLKPLGLLYFGRSADPFSREEAGRLRFVSERAEGGLKRAQERAEFTQALAEEKRVSKKLAHKVTLSSHLLKAAQRILGAPTEQAVYDTLAGSARAAVEHSWGAVILGDKSEPAVAWGQVPPLSDSDRAQFLSPEGGQQARRLGAELLHSFPVRGEAESIGAFLLGRPADRNLSGEEEDFLATLALLVGGGLEALRLSERLKEAHQQVLQASKLSAIGRLAAGVAHELNSPLAAIGLALESAMIRPEKAAQKLEKASGALERAKKIVSDLLEHSRTSGAKRTVVPLGTVFEGLLKLVEAQLLKRRLKLKKSCQEPNAGIMVNKEELDQVLINLILNAADASEDGQEIEVSATTEDLKVVIEVRDHGSGIPDADRSRVFDPFFTTKAVGRGTGLGLSVCRELVIRHQGQISFESELGKGTTFRLVFPRQDKFG